MILPLLRGPTTTSLLRIINPPARLSQDAFTPRGLAVTTGFPLGLLSLRHSQLRHGTKKARPSPDIGSKIKIQTMVDTLVGAGKVTSRRQIQQALKAIPTAPLRHSTKKARPSSDIDSQIQTIAETLVRDAKASSRRDIKQALKAIPKASRHTARKRIKSARRALLAHFKKTKQDGAYQRVLCLERSVKSKAKNRTYVATCESRAEKLGRQSRGNIPHGKVHGKAQGFQIRRCLSGIEQPEVEKPVERDAGFWQSRKEATHFNEHHDETGRGRREVSQMSFLSLGTPTQPFESSSDKAASQLEPRHLSPFPRVLPQHVPLPPWEPTIPSRHMGQEGQTSVKASARRVAGMSEDAAESSDNSKSENWGWKMTSTQPTNSSVDALRSKPLSQVKHESKMPPTASSAVLGSSQPQGLPDGRRDGEGLTSRNDQPAVPPAKDGKQKPGPVNSKKSESGKKKKWSNRPKKRQGGHRE